MPQQGIRTFAMTLLSWKLFSTVSLRKSAVLNLCHILAALRELGVFSLHQQHMYTDLLITYKFTHDLMDMPAKEIGLHQTPRAMVLV